MKLGREEGKLLYFHRRFLRKMDENSLKACFAETLSRFVFLFLIHRDDLSRKTCCPARPEEENDSGGKNSRGDEKRVGSSSLAKEIREQFLSFFKTIFPFLRDGGEKEASQNRLSFFFSLLAVPFVAKIEIKFLFNHRPPGNAHFLFILFFKFFSLSLELHFILAASAPLFPVLERIVHFLKPSYYVLRSLRFRDRRHIRGQTKRTTS